MKKDDIIRMAQEAGVTAERVRDLVNFAALVASAEREAIAEMVEPCLLHEYVEKIRNRGKA